MIDLTTDIWSDPVRSLHTRRLSATTAGAVRTSTFAIWSGDGEVVQLAPASSRLVRLKRPILFHCQKVPTYRSEYRRLRLFWEQTEVDRIRCESMTSSCGAPIRFAKGCYTATRQASKRWARPWNRSSSEVTERDQGEASRSHWMEASTWKWLRRRNIITAVDKSRLRQRHLSWRRARATIDSSCSTAIPRIRSISAARSCDVSFPP